MLDWRQTALNRVDRGNISFECRFDMMSGAGRNAMRCKYSISATAVLRVLVCVVSFACASAQSISPSEAREIAREAYTYGYPLLENYAVVYSHFVDSSSPQFKAPWNHLRNVFASANTARPASASGTRSSQLGADLRAEPLVLILPDLGKHRYDLVQVIDLFAFDLTYAGGRSTGNEGGTFLLAGPGWSGDKPNGIKDVIRSSTDFAFLLYRRQLLGPAEADSREKTQAEFKVQPLHEFRGEPAPPAAPKIDFMNPIVVSQQSNALQVFDLLNFVLRFCPDNPARKNLMARFAKIGIGPDANFSFNSAPLSPAMKQALAEGAADALLFQERDYRVASEAKAAAAAGANEFLESAYPRARAEGIDESNPMAQDVTYWIILADSATHRFDEANEFPLPSFDQQALPIDAILSLGIYEPPLGFLHPNPYDPYWIDGP